MKIPIDIKKKQLNNYISLLFHYLERDKSFEDAIIKARKNLKIHERVIPELKNLDIRFIPEVTLRSENLKTKSITPEIFIERFQAVLLRNETDLIISKYPFLEDWRTGVESLICGDRFLIPSEETIKLRVNNKQYKNRGGLSEKHSEQGVKILITSTISKNELIDWIEINFLKIKTLLKEFDSTDIYRSRRTNLDRDKLACYLNSHHHMSYDKIADIINDGETTANALQKSCKHLYQ